MPMTWDPFAVGATVPISAVRGPTTIGRTHPHAPRSKFGLPPPPARAAAVTTAAVAGVVARATPFARFPVAGVPLTLRKVAIVAHSPPSVAAAVVAHSTAVASAAMTASAAMGRRRGQRRTAGGNCSRSQTNCNLVNRCFAEHAFAPLSGSAPQPLSVKLDSDDAVAAPECHGTGHDAVPPRAASRASAISRAIAIRAAGTSSAGMPTPCMIGCRSMIFCAASRSRRPIAVAWFSTMTPVARISRVMRSASSAQRRAVTSW
jgi:hypothetical protein